MILDSLGILALHHLNIIDSRPHLQLWQLQGVELQIWIKCKNNSMHLHWVQPYCTIVSSIPIINDSITLIHAWICSPRGFKPSLCVQHREVPTNSCKTQIDQCESSGLTGPLISRTRAMALNSSVVGVAAPVQTISILVYKTWRIEGHSRTINDALFRLSDLASNLGIRVTWRAPRLISLWSRQVSSRTFPFLSSSESRALWVGGHGSL